MGNLGKIAYFRDIDHFHASYHYCVTNWDRRLSEVSYESLDSRLSSEIYCIMQNSS